MGYTLTYHAQQRKEEYKIPDALIAEALREPTAIGYDHDGHMMVKKLCRRGGKQHILILVGDVVDDSFKIITIITSSKVKKYLSR